VDDLIDGLVRLMASPASFTGPVNLGNPVELTMRELAEHVLTETGSSSKFINLPLPQDDPKQRQPDISLANAQLGWARRSNWLMASNQPLHTFAARTNSDQVHTGRPLN